ncbi:MAG: HNH endonuclease [Oscillospiraceae bacterium]|nr:HNH endonuclease [Oscillospiraceae bacterium]
MKIRNLAEYAKDNRFVVFRMVDGEAWYYDSWADYEKALAQAIEIGGQVAPVDEVCGDQDAERMNQWSQIVRNGDDRRCHICGSDIQVEAHHIIPRSHDPQGRWWYSPTNGIALCRRCHEQVHGEWMARYNKRRD